MLTVRSFRAGALALTLIAVLRASALAQESDDTIRLKDGQTRAGKIQSEDFGGVALSLSRGAATVVPWKSIQSIQYAGAPEFTRAMEAFTAGSLTDAQTLFEGLKKDQKLRPVLRQQVLYHLALTNQRLGHVNEAIDGYLEVLKSFPKSRYLRSAGENLIACNLGKNDPAGADKALETLLTGAKAAGLESEFQVELGLLKGRVLEAQKKFSEARSAYSAAEKAPGAAPGVVQAARLGLARCLQLENKTAEAEQQYRSLVTEDAPNAILAGAWNGIGEITMKEGFQKRDADKLLDALYAHLRGVVQYAPVAGEPTAEYERALAGSQKCFQFISDLEKNPERKKLYAERARQRGDQLKKEFPQSVYLAERG